MVRWKLVSCFNYLSSVCFIIKWGYVSIKDCQDLISNETLSNLFFRLTLPTNIKEIKRLNFVKLKQTRAKQATSRNLFAVKNSLVYKYPILFHILVAGTKVWKRCSLDNREVRERGGATIARLFEKSARELLQARAPLPIIRPTFFPRFPR